jgi:hypothetical protein
VVGYGIVDVLCCEDCCGWEEVLHSDGPGVYCTVEWESAVTDVDEGEITHGGYVERDMDLSGYTVQVNFAKRRQGGLQREE